MSDVLGIAREQDCVTFTLNRPDKMNALDAALVEALLEGVDQAHASGARVLAFRGAGRNFSAGFDSGDLDKHSEGDLLLRFVRIEALLQTIAASPCVTMAFAHGRNFGAGVDLFAVCRQRFATADASFRMPGLRFGLVLGSRRFADLVGQAKALDILENASVVAAARAAEIGLVTRLLGPEDWADALANAQRVADALDSDTRQQLYRVLDRDLPDRDLAALVRSATRPGLKQRMAEYFKQP